MAVRIRSTGPFQQLYNLPPDTNLVICIGGRGGRKTYEVSKFSAFASTIKSKRVAVLRDEKENVRESILNEIFLRFDTANIGGNIGPYVRNESGIRNTETGAMHVFTKGFRASSKQQTANLKSISDVDIAIIEEAEDIRDPVKFNIFADSIRKTNSLIIIVLNTPDINHWIIKRYFNLLPITLADVTELNHVTDKDLDGYWKIEPKNIPGFVCIQTSYTDNEYLPDHIKSNYRGYGNPSSHLYDLHYYLTAIRGFASSGRKGQVFKKVKRISMAEYLALPYKEVFGQDFGTAAPAGLIGAKIHRNSCWARQISYKPMDVLALGKLYCDLGFDVTDKIVADSADRDSRVKLRDGWQFDELPEEEFVRYPALARGFFVVPAKKPAGSITAGIDLMTGMNLFIVEESKDFWNEVYNYVYAQDKNGNYTNDPIDDFNHCIDPWRYVIQEEYRGDGISSTAA